MSFDKQYYEKYYQNPQTRAVSPTEQRQQANFIAAYLKHLDIPVHSVVDMGCGLGVLLKSLQKTLPKSHCIGVENSNYLCENYGWEQGSVETYSSESSEPFDLVVCNDVLAYLNKKACAAAIRNLARPTQSALYLSVVTSEDMDICDTQRTDMRQKLRPVSWYQHHLNKYFVNVGGGIFLKRPLAFAVWRIART